MSEAFPLPNLGGTDQKPLAAVPEIKHTPPKFNFADHGGAELATRLTNIPDEQFNATRHALERSTSESETIKLMINYAANMIGMLPSSDAADYDEYQKELRSQINNALDYYREEFMDKSGRLDIDKLETLYDSTDDYSDSSVLQLLHNLKAHANTVSPEYFIASERVVRILIANELSDKPTQSDA